MKETQITTKEERLGGIDADLEVDLGVVLHPIDTIKAVFELPVNAVKAVKNTIKALGNLGKSVVSNLTGNGKDGVSKDYQGNIRNQELALQV
ncbi:MAG: hypothetical protein HRT90_09570, partial [Candidatus Margulisbacteria bacterium]|nr:hypothetical protein [Candidatus Margulisiibacteriota bacterium]